LAALLLVLKYTEELVEIRFVLIKKIVSKLHIPCWILLKETVQVIFNQK